MRSQLSYQVSAFEERKCQASCIICSHVHFIGTLEYLIAVEHLMNVHNGNLCFVWLAKKDNLMLMT